MTYFSLKHIFFFIVIINITLVVFNFQRDTTPQNQTNGIKYFKILFLNCLASFVYTGNPQMMNLRRNPNYIRNDSQEIIVDEGKESKVETKFVREEIEETNQVLRNKLMTANSKFKAQNETNSYLNAILQEMNPFRKLGIYKEMPAKYYNHHKDARLLHDIQYIGIKHNQAYCDSVDLYNLHNPDNIFKNMNFITDYSGEGNFDLFKKYYNDFRAFSQKKSNDTNW